MVIQRWQSVLLLLAVVAMGLACYMPVGVMEAGQVAPVDYPIYLIVNILAAVIVFIDIFLYKNLDVQRRVASVSLLLISVSVISALWIILGLLPAAVAPSYNGSALCTIVALILVWRARMLMGRDKKKLESYDRLR